MSVVSSVLSRVSTRSRPSIGWNVNVSFSPLMDSLFSIAFGLGLRFVVDMVSQQDFKLTGTLVGLWEGVILLHFTKKMPKSSDPYIAFAVRLCVDFYLTESVARLVLVLIWTGLGMILADITPAIWSDVGLNRVWRRFRRDLYTIGQMVPTVAFFPPQRTVRFSPSNAPTAVDADDAASDVTATPTEQTPSVPAPPPNPILPPSRDARKRRVPGHYGFEYSDTETERSYTPLGQSSGRTSRRLSVYPGQGYDDSASDSISSITPDDDVDAGNLSDGASSSGATERAGPSSTSIINMSEVQGSEEVAAGAAPTIDTAAAAAVAAKEGDDEAGNRTPTAQQPLWIPPTPSDSAAAWRLSRAREAANYEDGATIRPVRPLLASSENTLPQIPDFLEETRTEDWVDLGKPTTANAKSTTVPTTTMDTMDPTAEPPIESNSLLDPPAYEAGSSQQHQQRPETEKEYKTEADFEDIYGDEAPPPPPAGAGPAGEAAEFAGETADLLGGDAGEDVEGAGAGGAGGGGAPPTLDVTGLEDNVWGDEVAQAKEGAGAGEGEAGAGVDADADVDAAGERDEEIKRLDEEIARLDREAQEKEKEEEEKAALEAQRLADEAAAEAEAKRIADEAAAKAQAEIEAAQAAAEAEAAQAEAEAAKKEKKEKKKSKKAKEAADAAERKAKEEADEALRQQKRAEEEERERVEKEEREEKERKAQEEKDQKRKDAEAAAERRAQKAREKEEAAAAAVAAEAEAERKAKEEKEREEKERKEREEREEREQKEREAKEEAERKEREEAEAAEAAKRAQEEEQAASAKADAEAEAAADAALATALAQEGSGAVPGQEAADGSLPVSTGFSEVPLIALDDAAPQGVAAAPAYEESVVSDATAIQPADPKERLERMMILRAQMVEIQKQIDELKAGGAGEDSPQLKALEKVMRKMVRQATRRYAAGIECAEQFNYHFDGESDVVSLENINPPNGAKKIVEKIEYSLSPSARSLHLSIQVAKKPKDAQRQKPKVLEVLDDFNLINYVKEDAHNKKLSTVDIPEEEFDTWLTDYRKLVAKRAQQEQDEEDAWGYRH